MERYVMTLTQLERDELTELTRKGSSNTQQVTNSPILCAVQVMS